MRLLCESARFSLRLTTSRQPGRMEGRKGKRKLRAGACSRQGWQGRERGRNERVKGSCSPRSDQVCFVAHLDKVSLGGQL